VRIGVDELILILKKELRNQRDEACISENRGGVGQPGAPIAYRAARSLLRGRAPLSILSELEDDTAATLTSVLRPTTLNNLADADKISIDP
jgi:hypothetical protein